MNAEINLLPRPFPEEHPTGTSRLDNNSRSVQLELPSIWDVVVDSVTATTDSHWLAWFRNAGAGTVPAGWRIDLYASTTPNDQSTWRGAGTLTMPTTLTGSVSRSVLLDAAINWSAVSPGNLLVAVADAPNVIPETNEQNNRGTSVKPASQPAAPSPISPLTSVVRR